MGVIQSSINQAMGAVAAAGIGIKHVKEQEAANVISATREAVVAEEQANAAKTEAAEAVHKWYDWDEKLGASPAGELSYLKEARIPDLEKKKAKAEEKALKSGTFKDSRKVGEISSDLDAAKMARRELEIKQEAIKDLQTRAISRRTLADTLANVATNKNAKYEKKWGGNL